MNPGAIAPMRMKRLGGPGECEDPVAMGLASRIGVAATWLLPAAAPIAPALAAAYRIERTLPRGAGAVALTFDDGPHPEGTPATLAVLRDAGVRATFFLVGEQVERFPDLAREIASEGHEIGLHGFRHRPLVLRGVRETAEDISRAATAVGDVTGCGQSCYRPPFGVFSSGALSIVRRLGLRPVLWSRWGRDWEARATPESIAARASGRIAPGDIVLLHDADHYSVAGAWRNTVAALPFIIERARAAGATLEPISDSSRPGTPAGR